MVYVSPDTPYMRLFTNSGFLERKFRLAVDSWGADDKAVRYAYDPIAQLIKREVPNEEHWKLYPHPVWATVEDRTDRIARNILLAEFMIREWADHLKGMNEEQIDELCKSFLFENCTQRKGLNKVLTEHAAAVSSI